MQLQQVRQDARVPPEVQVPLDRREQPGRQGKRVQREPPEWKERLEHEETPGTRERGVAQGPPVHRVRWEVSGIADPMDRKGLPARQVQQVGLDRRDRQERTETPVQREYQDLRGLRVRTRVRLEQLDLPEMPAIQGQPVRLEGQVPQERRGHLAVQAARVPPE
jgi:hypothetical protein